MKRTALLLLLGLAGCAKEPSFPCDDTHVCQSPQRCTPSGRCADACELSGGDECPRGTTCQIGEEACPHATGDVSCGAVIERPMCLLSDGGAP